MKRNVFLRSLAFLIVFLLLSGIFFAANPVESYAANTTYYIDSVSGNDNKNGTSPSTAWKTLNKINSITLQPGDKVLFKAGCTFTGQFAPKGSGTEGNPIIIDKYGTGSNPLINGAGTVMQAVYLYNNAYIELHNLEITNHGATELNGRTGILVKIHEFGVANHIYLNNLYVHDVNSNSINKNAGGIIFDATGEPGSSVITKYNDVRITNCTIRNVNRTGINCGGSSKWEELENGLSYDMDDNLYSTNVLISNNVLDSVGGDPILLGYLKAPKVEYNVAMNSCVTSQAAGQASAGMWGWRCEDAVFQFNEVYGTHLNGDGHAFDCDYDYRTIFQYNYSHDNEGGFMLLCAEESRESIVRYNISQNDRLGLIDNVSPASAEIYNNTFYIGPGLDTRVFRRTSGRAAIPVYIENNIFYNEGTAKTVSWNEARCIYDNNIYYGYNTTPADNNKIIADPLFVNKGTGGLGINTLSGYKLSASSPAINAGKFMYQNGIALSQALDPLNNELTDYFGNPLYNGMPDIGAHEYSDQIFDEVTPPAYTPREPVYNYELANTGFEDINGFDVWNPWNQAEIVESNAHSGTHALKLYPGECSVEQYVNVQPNTTYILSAYIKNENSDDSGYLGVQNFFNGGDNQGVNVFGTQYTQGHLIFTTGPNDQSCTIYLYKTDSVGSIYADDFSLEEYVQPEIANVTATNGTLEITLQNNPQVAPAAADFKAVFTSGKVKDVPLELKNFTYNSALKKASFTFDPFVQISQPQSFAVTASFRGVTGTPSSFGLTNTSLASGINNAIAKAQSVNSIMTANPGDYLDTIKTELQNELNTMISLRDSGTATDTEKEKQLLLLNNVLLRVSSGKSVISNGGFEAGVLSPWGKWVANGSEGATIISNANRRSGAYACRLAVVEMDIERVVEVKPNTQYIFKAYVKANKANDAIYIGVDGYGGAKASNYYVIPAAGVYTEISIPFKTGINNTSATIFIYKEYTSGVLFVDDTGLFEIVETGMADADATNGMLTIGLDNIPTNNPVAGDFSAEISINGGVAQTLPLTGFTYDKANAEISFNFTPVTAENNLDLTVTIDVVYKEQRITAPSFIVPKANLINSNPGFENNLTGWSNNSVTVVTAASDVHSGAKAIKLVGNSSGWSGVYRTITGLSPNTSYTLQVYCKKGAGSTNGYIYVKNYGGSLLSSNVTGTSYTIKTINFVTGSTNTSVVIGCEIDSSNSGHYFFADDFVLKKAE